VGIGGRWTERSQGRARDRERFGIGKRAHRIGMVALARKLVIAWWRYATSGVMPSGAVMKAG
jgi:hypothetical protein